MFMKDFIEEFFEEIADFFEDFIEYLFKKEEIHHHAARKISVKGRIEYVEPAYLFAEKLDNFLKIVFGVSIFFSALTASFVGFIKLSDLLEFLITSFPGRSVMIVIGFSYLLLGFWRIISLEKK